MLVAQVENDTLTDMEELPRGDWWICPPPYRHTINQMFHFEMSIAWFSCMCAGRTRFVCVCGKGDAGVTAGLQRVLGAFALAYTRQLAARLQNEDSMRTGGWR